jgi:predicted Zn-dependent protease
MIKYILFFILFLGQLTGCATVQTGLDRQERIFITTANEVSIGKDVCQQVEKEYKILKDAFLTQYIDEVGQKIANVCFRQDIKYHFKILDSKIINAFAVPGGFIYITGGAISAMDDEAQLACVLGHEIAHIAARHGVKRIQAAIGTNILFSIIFKDDKHKTAQQIAKITANLIFLGHGRKAEFEADELGVHFAYQAGYDPRGAVEFFNKLKAKEKREPHKLEVLLSSHPPTSERINKVKSKIYTLPKKHDLIRNEAKFKAMTKHLAERY